MLSETCGVRVDEPFKVVDSVTDDNFDVSIHGERREHLSHGSCILSCTLAMNEMARSYVLLLSVPHGLTTTV